MDEKEKSSQQEGADITTSAISQKPVRESEDRHLKTRRRLIKVGLMSLPVLMTVRSRPAFAQSLGSVGLPYGGYLQEKIGGTLVENDLVPVKVNEYGEPVDIYGNVIDFNDPNAYKDQEIMLDPTRRSDATINYQKWKTQ